MEAKDLLKHMNYYKGEDRYDCPFESGSDDGLFWYLESMFFENVQRSNNELEGWKCYARRYIEEHPNEKNVLTDNDVSIETKAIILYCEEMMRKWMPYSVDRIFRYKAKRISKD